MNQARNKDPPELAKSLRKLPPPTSIVSPVLELNTLATRKTKHMTTTIPNEIEKQITSYLLAQHRGTIGGDGLFLLQKMKRDYDVSDERCAEMLDAALKAKAQAAADKAKASTFPQDSGEVLIPPTFTDQWLDWRFVEAHLQTDAPRLDASRIRFHRPEDLDAKDFSYLADVVKALHVGELTPGRVLYVHPESERYPAQGVGLRIIDPTSPPIGFQPDQFNYIRRRGQSDRAMKAALKTLHETWRQRGDVNEMRPANQQASPSTWRRW